MCVSFKRSLNAINEFVESKKLDEKVLGIIVFGSFVKGTLRKTSDIDVLLLMKDGKYARRIERYDDLKFEVYMAPAEILTSSPKNGRNLFFEMFRLQVLRTGRIFYDQEGLLSQLSAEASNQKIPYFYEKIMLNRTYKRLRYAEKYFWTGRLRQAKSELQAASIEAARTLLLRMDEPEINIPKLIIPHLRRIDPNFYNIFREIHGLNNLGKSDIELEFINSLNYLRKITNKYSVMKYFRDVINRARFELLNAKDCLEYGDYDSAILQLKLFMSILNSHLPIKPRYLSDTYSFSNQCLSESPTKIRRQLSILKDVLADRKN